MRIEGDRLTGRWGSGQRHATVTPGMLDAFLRLADAPDDAILGFAERWGVLRLCASGSAESDRDHEHHQGNKARQHAKELGVPVRGGWCDPALGRDDIDFMEPLAAWRNYAARAATLLTARAATLLTARAAMATSTPISPEVWATLSYGTQEWIRWRWANVILQMDPAISPTRAARYRAGALADANESIRRTRAGAERDARGDPDALGSLSRAVLDAWIVEADVRPRATDGPDGAGIAFGALFPSAFDALVVLVMLAALRRSGLAVCSGCGVPYGRDRRPQRGRRNYCPDCRAAKVDRRDAQTAWAARNPDYFRLHRRQGLSGDH